MNFERYVNGKLYAIFEFLYKLMLINIIWVLFNIVGLGIIFLVPTTVAMYLLINSIVYKKEFPLVKSFWAIFKKEFIKSQKLFVLLVIIGSIIAFDLNFFYQNFIAYGTLFYTIGMWVFIILAILYLFMLIHLVPIYIHFSDLKVTQILKYAFITSMIFPLHTIAILIINGIVISLVLTIPILSSMLPLILFSSLTYLSLFILRTKYKILLKDNQPTNVFDYIDM